MPLTHHQRFKKEILHIFSTKVKNTIREEIGDAKYCIIVDEAHDESKNEQMAIVLRFIDKDGFVREHFFGLIYVSKTAASTLKDGIYSVLSHHNLDIQNIRGQGYDGVSNMRVVQAVEIKHMIDIDELETGKGLNQIGTLQRAGDTCWSSHFKSVSSLIKIFSPTCEVLLNIINEGTTSAQRGDADSAYETLTSFEFAFILHLMKEILEITDLLCQALQCRSQDILNAMNLVSSTKALLQKFRDDKWDALLANVQSFCEWLVRTNKSTIYQLVYRVITLVLTLPVSTATTERSFSAMKIVKSRLRNKMEDKFLTDSLLVYIEKEIVENFITESIIEDFRDMKERRVPL
ncbi:zinc finger MYM-type protein 1-like [Camellia sinensis]|uniref:zinc finger MYM-type protein 1-like n=1 Tax=Camellia sinensis TaxID=4442 RepID=UPI001035C415|nr:zinc finger MYM-type protein 1-like [Camellia sinensis]